jgi:polyphenol oxidase
VVDLLKSSLIAAPHGFPTREGGVSKDPFSSLNASFTVGDEPNAVAENLRRLELAAQVKAGNLITVTQVHGDTVVEAVVGAATPMEADGLWTEEPGVAVGIRTADCVPILLADPIGRRVAAVHAGWRGVIGDVLGRALSALRARGTRLENLRMAIGPCARACCFEVDGDLPQQFAKTFGPEVVVAIPGRQRVHLDLPLSLARSAASAGLLESQVEVIPHCTMCEGRFFSHRRQKGLTGRHLSFITCKFP